MGASSKFMSLNADLSKEQVEKIFEERQEEDRDYYGNDPYNGSWTTFCGIKFISKVFDTEDGAVDYILENAEKWGYALAVKVEEPNNCSWLIGGWAAE